MLMDVRGGGSIEHINHSLAWTIKENVSITISHSDPTTNAHPFVHPSIHTFNRPRARWGDGDGGAGGRGHGAGGGGGGAGYDEWLK